MRTLLVALAVLATAGCAAVPRPGLEGTFDGYRSHRCGRGGYVVRGRLTPRENTSEELVRHLEAYFEERLRGRLADIADITGVALDAGCTHAGMKILISDTSEARFAEALHAVGETLRDHPLDIEIVLIVASGPIEIAR